MDKNQLLGPQHKTAIAFINAIFRDHDVLDFWNIISSEAQGFFKGVWYNKGIIDFNQLGEIDPAHFLIEEQLDEVLESIKKTWDVDINDYIIANKVIYDDQFHSKVNFIYNRQTSVTATPMVVNAVSVPMVYELTAPREGRNPVWKVDFLKLSSLFPISI